MARFRTAAMATAEPGKCAEFENGAMVSNRLHAWPSGGSCAGGHTWLSNWPCVSPVLDAMYSCPFWNSGVGFERLVCYVTSMSSPTRAESSGCILLSWCSMACVARRCSCNSFLPPLPATAATVAIHYHHYRPPSNHTSTCLFAPGNVRDVIPFPRYTGSCEF